MPVLTMFTSQIATRTCDAESEMARNEMVERCLFDGPDVNNRRLTINEGIELPFL
jgi:hypothetical protein